MKSFLIPKSLFFLKTFPITSSTSFSCDSAGKENPPARPGFDPWVGKIPWRKEKLPALVFWPGEFHGLYSPWGCKEPDMTERLSLHFTSRTRKAVGRYIQLPLLAKLLSSHMIIIKNSEQTY